MLRILSLLSLVVLCPDLGWAVKPNGTTKTTMVLKYYPDGTPYWCMRVDPQDVESFQLHVSFDSARVQLDNSFGNVSDDGVLYKFPFTRFMLTTGSGGNTLQISGSNTSLNPVPGDVDIFELRFIDMQPGLPIDNVPFTVFATGSDFLGVFDSDTSQHLIISATNIGSVTRTATPGVSPMVWDPDGLYDSGITGGGGTWSTSGTQWDALPTTFNGPLANTTWSNTANRHDFAVFSGTGPGLVSVSGLIATGGFQFDISGYVLQSGTLELSGASNYVPTIDMGENDATISSVLSGTSGVRKLGLGTLILTGSNTFTGGTTINAGAIQISADANLGATSNPLLFNGGILRSSTTMTLNPNRLVTVSSAGGAFDVAAGTLGFGGIVTGSGALTKTGAGALVFSGNASQLGGTVVNNGTLVNNGVFTGNVNVNRGTLSGTGSIGATLTVGDGTMASGTSRDALVTPGTSGSIATLLAQSLIANSDAVFQFDLQSTTQTADRIQLSGSSNLGLGLAQILFTDLGSSLLAINTTFTLIDNLSALPTTGFFAGLPGGSTFVVGLNQYQINYNTGTDSNDVQLKVVPEPGACALVLGGLGLLCLRRFRR